MTPLHKSYPSGWEVQWETLSSDGVVARNPLSRNRSARRWHVTPCGYLRIVGVPTPVYRKDSWEIDWGKRNGKLVWGRNSDSKMPSARLWHWIDFHTVSNAGIAWRPASVHDGRYTNKDGYVHLTRKAMTETDIEIAERFGIFRGRRKTFVREHHLVAVKKFKRSLGGMVVRHWNGIKDDNSPDNILLGTSAENTMDHNTARLAAIYWRNKYEELMAQEVGSL